LSHLSSDQIDFIASEVVSYLKSDMPSDLQHKESMTPISDTLKASAGIFNDLDEAVKAAKIAQKQLIDMPLEKRKVIIANIRRHMLLYAEDLATRAHNETGLGRREDKITKNQLVTNKTPGVEFLTPSAQSGDRGLTLMELAMFWVITLTDSLPKAGPLRQFHYIMSLMLIESWQRRIRVAKWCAGFLRLRITRSLFGLYMPLVVKWLELNPSQPSTKKVESDTSKDSTN